LAFSLLTLWHRAPHWQYTSPVSGAMPRGPRGAALRADDENLRGGAVPTEAGEYIVGAYLQYKYDCDIVLYNERQRGGKLARLPELDVVGINLAKREAILCEVTTHILGMMIKDVPTTIQKLKDKHKAQRDYAANRLQKFDVRYMFWSPVLSSRKLIAALSELVGVEIVINGEYKRRVAELRAIAKASTHETGNPFMRTLQILEHLRDDEVERRAP
jgi:hypothetical protein